MTVTAAVNATREVEAFGENRDGDQIRVTVAAGTDIPKNSIIKAADNRTGSQADGTGDVVLGVSRMDKEGDDPSTSLSVATNTIEEFTASGAIVFGQRVKTASGGTANLVMAATDADITSSYAIAFATALKTVATMERVQCRMRCLQ